MFLRGAASKTFSEISVFSEAFGLTEVFRKVALVQKGQGTIAKRQNSRSSQPLTFWALSPCTFHQNDSREDGVDAHSPTLWAYVLEKGNL